MPRKSVLKKTVLTLAAVSFLAAPVFAEEVIVPSKVSEAVSPMPQIMDVVVAHARTLQLTPKQLGRLTMWRENNKAKYARLAWKVRFGEKAINDAVLKGASADVVEARTAEVVKARLAIVALKAQCRDMVRDVLNDAQWQKAVSLVRSTQTSNRVAIN